MTEEFLPEDEFLRYMGSDPGALRTMVNAKVAQLKEQLEYRTASTAVTALNFGETTHLHHTHTHTHTHTHCNGNKEHRIFLNEKCHFSRWHFFLFAFQWVRILFGGQFSSAMAT